MQLVAEGIMGKINVYISLGYTIFEQSLLTQAIMVLNDLAWV